jgi:hypothetical protein
VCIPAAIKELTRPRGSGDENARYYYYDDDDDEDDVIVIFVV